MQKNVLLKLVGAHLARHNVFEFLKFNILQKSINHNYPTYRVADDHEIKA